MELGVALKLAGLVPEIRLVNKDRGTEKQKKKRLMPGTSAIWRIYQSD